MKFYADKKQPLFVYNLKMNSREKESAVSVIDKVLGDSKELSEEYYDV